MSRQQPPLKFDYAIICDQIRREDNNKLVLIGVYSGDILVEKFPAAFPIAAWLHGYASKTGDTPLSVRFKVDQEGHPQIKATADGSVGVKKIEGTGEFTVSIQQILLKPSGPGKLTIDYRLGDGRWKKLAEKRINLS